jgi:hypothetical protein
MGVGQAVRQRALIPRPEVRILHPQPYRCKMFDKAIMQLKITRYRGQEVISKTVAEVHIDTAIDEVIEQIKSFLYAAGFAHESIAEYIAD